MSENVFGFLLMNNAVRRRAYADSICVRFASDPSVSTCGNVSSSCMLLARVQHQVTVTHLCRSVEDSRQRLQCVLISPRDRHVEYDAFIPSKA